MTDAIRPSDEPFVAACEVVHCDDIRREISFMLGTSPEPMTTLDCWWCSEPYQIPVRLARWLARHADVVSGCPSCREAVRS